MAYSSGAILVVLGRLLANQSCSKHINAKRHLCESFAIVVVAIISIATQVMADTLSYCVTAVGETHTLLPSNSDRRRNESPQITINLNNETYYIIAGEEHLFLKDDLESSQPLAVVEVKQYGTNIIKALALGEDDWLWVDGYEDDYLVQIDLDGTKPTIGLPTALPELYTEPCSSWGRYVGNCSRREQVFYSTTLQRPFIRGHQVNFFGKPRLVTYEIVEGEARQLPINIQDSPLLVDISELGGVILEGLSGETLFYDGADITLIFDISQRQNFNRDIPDWFVTRTPLDGRIFLTNIDLVDRYPFLIELQPGLVLQEISLPPEVVDSWIELFSMPDDRSLWGVSRYRIIMGINDELNTVLTVPETSYIKGRDLSQDSDGSIVFSVWNSVTSSPTNYLILPTSEAESCEVILDEDRSVVLNE
ncbi:hypothetical protein [Synechococcus sp. PCC 7336]|uniref:hypothetical protein n=1 Tax=Synechococcus sp. PCC 7336 TaxID=195250 RepID=UPI0003466601|nr:hypothetical protein [Synechococcus sp. PCC 7336]